jgi:photosystem II stability/assembly factor-like uncharacterized protein
LLDGPAEARLSRVSRRASVFCVAFAAIVLHATTAGAHAGLWRAFSVAVEPGDPDRIVLRSDVWGIVSTRDGGASWTWMCSEAHAGSSLFTERRALVVLPGGGILVASELEGLWQSSPDGCSWAPVAALEGVVVRDVASLRDGSLLVVGVEGALGDEDSQAWASIDAGGSWSRLGESMPLGFAATSIRAGSAGTLYVAGTTRGSPERAALLRSTDEGVTWESLDGPIYDGDFTPRIAGVDPSDDGRLYVWLDHAEAGGGDVQPDAVWFSTDAGDTWTLAVQGTGDLPGFAFSPDGATVLVAGPEDGVWRADDAAVAAATDPFERVSSMRIFGLAWTDTGLLAGGDDFAPRGAPRFSLGISTDEARSFEPLLEICDVGPSACAPDTEVGGVCGDFFSIAVVGGFKEDFLESTRCVAPGEGGFVRVPLPDAGSDAGEPPARSDSPGCGCTLARSSGAARAGLLVVIGWIVLRRRRAA